MFLVYTNILISILDILLDKKTKLFKFILNLFVFLSLIFNKETIKYGLRGKYLIILKHNINLYLVIFIG